MADGITLEQKEKDLAERALVLLGYTKVKEGVWKHSYFTHSQLIDTKDGKSVILSLHQMFKDWGYRDCQKDIRQSIGCDE